MSEGDRNANPKLIEYLSIGAAAILIAVTLNAVSVSRASPDGLEKRAAAYRKNAESLLEAADRLERRAEEKRKKEDNNEAGSSN